jgi:hypothetical protein
MCAMMRQSMEAAFVIAFTAKPLALCQDRSTNAAANSHPRFWPDWPLCPGCGQPRQTICPVCQEAGIEFPLAEYQMLPEPLRRPSAPEPARASAKRQPENTVLLVCPTCDEAFTPMFYPRCQQCGHVFLETVDENTELLNQLTPRVLFTAIAVLLLGWGFLLYFWFILRWPR